MRKGEYGDFDPAKMLPGEWAVVLADDPVVPDGKSVFICFGAGSVKRMATYEEMKGLFGDMTDAIVKRLTTEVGAVVVVAKSAAAHANTAADTALAQALAAEEAANMAENVAEDLISRRDAGEFKGHPGDPGPQGPPGESGVVVPVSGMFTLAGDADGNLWAYYADGGDPPQFETDADGNIYYITPEE